MLIDAIKQHGKKQIEVKQKIRITDKTKKLKYRVDTFFIFPGALQITENNFKKEEFKHNLKCYLSLSEQSPSLSGLRNELSELRLSPGQEEESDDFYRRFCLKYKTALQESSRSLMENQELSVEETEAFLQTVNKLLEEFRKIKSSQENSDHLVQLLDKLDEYLTVVTALCLRDLSEVCIGEPRNKILSFWQEVEKYRASRFPVESIEGESKESAFLMRWSFLKKFVQSSLFLDIRYKQGAPLLTHSIYGSAAALSMLFATVVAFFYQDRYGSLSRNLFFALVIAYIFKDRFKEIVRDWLSNVIFRRWIPDRRLFIFLERKKLDAQRKISTLCLLMNSPFPTKIFCKRMLVCYPIAFGNPSLRHMLVIPFSAIAEKLRSQLQNSPTKLVSLTLFASISRNFSITWEQHRRGFLFSAITEKVRKARSFTTYISFDHSASEKKVTQR